MFSFSWISPSIFFLFLALTTSELASVRAHASDCESVFGSLETSAVKGARPYGRLTKANYVRQYVERHHSDITEADKESFIARTLSPPRDDEFYFVAQNPILKEMNDILFKDKNLSTAVTNHMMKNLLRAMRDGRRFHGGGLASQIVNRYANYKSVEFIVKDTPENRLAVSEAYNQAMERFERMAGSVPFEVEPGKSQTLKEMTNERRGIAGDPGAWFLAGMGKTSDEADLASRYARMIASIVSDGHTRVQDFEQLAPRLVDFADRAEHFRQTLQEDFSHNAGILVPSLRDPNKMILSQQAIELLRKVKVNSRNYGASTAWIQKVFFDVFGIKVKSSLASVLLDYFTYIDLFSPGIHPTVESGIKLPSGENGALGVDFVGLGAMNLGAVMEAMIPDPAELNLGPAKRVRLIISRTRDGVDRVSTALDLKKEIFRDLLGNAYFSGDDGVHYPSRQFAPLDVMAVMQGWANSSVPAEGRFSYVPPTYEDGRSILDIDLTRFRSMAESLEKDVRLRSTNKRTRTKLKDIVIGIYYQPKNEAGGGSYQLLLAGKRAQDASLVNLLKHSFDEAWKELASKDLELH